MDDSDVKVIVKPNNFAAFEIQDENNINIISDDTGVWDIESKDDISFRIRKGPSQYQHQNDTFEKSK